MNVTALQRQPTQPTQTPRMQARTALPQQAESRLVDSVELSSNAAGPDPASPLLDPSFQFLLGSSLTVAATAAGLGKMAPLVIESYWIPPGQPRQGFSTHFDPLHSSSVFSAPPGQANFLKSSVDDLGTLRVQSTFGDDVEIRSLQPEAKLKTNGVHVKGVLAGQPADFEITLRGNLNRGNENLQGFDVKGTLGDKEYTVSNDFVPRPGTTSYILRRGKLHSHQTLGDVKKTTVYDVAQGGKLYSVRKTNFDLSGWEHTLRIPHYG